MSQRNRHIKTDSFEVVGGMSEYISILEFAKRAGVSHQAIYKRLDKDLQPFAKVENRKKVINTKALELFEYEKPPPDATSVATVRILEKTVEMLQNELEIKNKQIEELNERLKESHYLAGQGQKLIALQDREKEVEANPDSEELKKKWWQKIF